jgi:hypothetical protein
MSADIATALIGDIPAVMSVGSGYLNMMMSSAGMVLRDVPDPFISQETILVLDSLNTAFDTQSGLSA